MPFTASHGQDRLRQFDPSHPAAFAEETRNKLRLFADVPDDHPVWSERPYKVFLYTPEDVPRVVTYIEENPAKEGVERFGEEASGSCVRFSLT